MPKLTQSVPKYRLHRQSGQAIVTVNGRDHLLGPHGTKASKLEYDRIISEWLSSGRSLSYGAPERDYSVVELVADYIRHAAAYHGKDARGEYEPETMKQIEGYLKTIAENTGNVDRTTRSKITTRQE